MKALLVPLVLLALAVSGCDSKSTFIRGAVAKTQIAIFSTALDNFKEDVGRYPYTSEGLAALVVCPKNIPITNGLPDPYVDGARRGTWHGPYLDGAIPLDPWRHAYVYRYPGIHNTNGFDLYSCGPDGISKSGGADPDDINNWDQTGSAAKTMPAPR